MTLLACYGGTFDPVHCGHLAVARDVRDALAAELRLLPAADPPHKLRTFAAPAHRVRMLALAVEGEAGLSLDLRELERGGPSYTVDTLLALRADTGPARPIAWLVGSDALQHLGTWHAWRRLFELAHVVAVERPGTSLDLAALQQTAPEVADELCRRRQPAADLARSPAGGFAAVPLRRPRAESSTDIRRRIADGTPWQALVPAAVAAYIAAQGLYRDRVAVAASL